MILPCVSQGIEGQEEVDRDKIWGNWVVYNEITVVGVQKMQSIKQ